MLCYITHAMYMGYNTCYVMLCYIIHDGLCYITHMLCYITHDMYVIKHTLCYLIKQMICYVI